MEELDDDDDQMRGKTWSRSSPEATKRVRSDGEDSGVDADDRNAPDALQGELATVMMNQLRLFENKLSRRAISMREQDQSSRELDKRQTQDQMGKLDVVKMRQAQTLSAAAERMGDGIKQLSAHLEENQLHIRKRIAQIALRHGRVNTFAKGGWMPDPWEKSSSVRESPVNVGENGGHPARNSPLRAKQEAFPPPRKEQRGKLPAADPDEMSFPSSGFNECPSVSRNEGVYYTQATPVEPTTLNPIRAQSIADVGSVATLSNLRKICDHPKFDPPNLDSWKREMHFWRSLYGVIPDDQIVAAARLQGSSELMEIVMDFTDANRALPIGPSFATFLRRIGREYGALAEAQRMGRLQSIMKF